jgi:hypothetical protein
VLFDRGWRGQALEDFDICSNRNWLDVFEVLISRALNPGQELLDRPVMTGENDSDEILTQGLSADVID